MTGERCDCGKGEWCPEFGSAFKAANGDTVVAGTDKVSKLRDKIGEALDSVDAGDFETATRKLALAVRLSQGLAYSNRVDDAPAGAGHEVEAERG